MNPSVRRLKATLFTVIPLLLTGLIFGQSARPALAAGDPIPDHYIVLLRAGEDAPAVADEMGRALGLQVGHVYTRALQGFAARIPAARLARLAADPRVLSITPDTLVTIAAPPCGTPKNPTCPPTPSPTPTPEPTPPPPGSQTIPTGVSRIFGPSSSTAAGNGTGTVNVDVAIIDTGVADHADLTVVGGYNCSTGPTNKYGDGHGHGTHVAGTVAALDNGFGVVGVAPGARIWAVRVLNNAGSGTRSSVICGIDWVTANANTIEVANMSLGGTGTDDGLSCAQTTDPYKKAICNSVGAGVTYAVAAGNDADNAANHVPAAYDQVITVSALADFDGQPGGLGSPTCRSDVDDTFANFSNFGADVDIIAPGVCIESTWKDGGYNTISGTSMATPHVAGAAALYKANNPGASPAQVQNALQNAGNFNWNNGDDPDGNKEPLLDVSGF